MAKSGQPRHGSMQYWPRKRAAREHPRVRTWASSNSDTAALLGFAGYKVGMTHTMVVDNRPKALTKGDTIAVPVTIVECPDIVILGLNAYKKENGALKIAKTILSDKSNKNVKRTLLENKQKHDFSSVENMADKLVEVRALVHTQPYKTNIGKKKPEVFEISLQGNVKSKIEFLKNHLGKEVSVSDVLKEGQLVDIHAVTKGKGFQGPVKRFGVGLRQHKAEKVKRGPGSLGPWRGQGHVMYRVAHAGQMGYHTRTFYNSWIVKMSDKLADINTKEGFRAYGVVKNKYLLFKGSLPGPAKRMLKFTAPMRPNKKIPTQAPQMEIMINR